LGVSFLSLVATVNLNALLAVPAATFFLWAPVALAARRNSAARRGRNIGLWRARVLAVSTQAGGSFTTCILLKLNLLGLLLLRRVCV